MANEYKTIIDVEARFTDNTEGVSVAQKRLDDLQQTAKKTKSTIIDLNGAKANPTVSADDSKFAKAMKKSEDRLAKFGKSKAEASMSIKDRATEFIERASAKAKAFAGRAYNALLTVSNSDAMKGIGMIKQGLTGIVGRAWRVTVGLTDKVTAPVRKLVGQLNSVLGLAGVGISSYGLVIKPVQMQVEYQDLITQFEVLLGSADKAQQRIEELTTFAGQTPFTRDELYKASRILEVYTEGALSRPDSQGGMKMVGDIAAGTNTDYLSVATWMGRLYSAMKGGRSVGEMTAALQEMGALSAEARNRIEALAESGEDISKTWPKVTQEFSRFDDIMLKQSDNLGNLLLGVKSFINNNFLKKLGLGISDSLTPFLKKFRTWRSENKELIAGWSDSVQKFATMMSGKVLGSVEKVAKKMQDVFKSDEFKEAEGFWGKAKVAWDKIIAEPLSEWWNGSGKWKVVEFANKAGKFIGTGITAAVLAVFGIETDIVGEGMDVGRSFIDGFKAGFDGAEVASAIWDGMSSFFAQHPFISLLLGGAGIGKLVGQLSPIVSPFITGGKMIASAMGTPTAGAIGTSVFTKLAGAQAIPYLGGGYIAAGGLMKGAVIPAGLASGLGLGAVAGGLAGGATLLSGGYNLYHGYSADNSYDKKYNYAKGGTKIGGVAAGAGIGALIGGPVGALIGAGVGGLAGWLSSGKVAKWFAGGKEGAEKYAASSSKAAAELEEIKKKEAELARSTLDKKFGEISLSADEVTKSVENMFNSTQTKRINSATAAIEAMTNSFSQLQEADNGFKKQLWLTSMKQEAKMTEEEISSLKESAKTFGSSAKQYIEDSQYAAHESVVSLLGNSKAAKEIIKSNNEYYNNQQSQLKKLNDQLSSELDKALKDGKISIDEQASLDEIRQKISKITNEIANDEHLANMEVMKLKLEGDIDWDSFNQIIETGYKSAQERIQKLEEEYGRAAAHASEQQKEILKWGDDLTGQTNGLYKQEVDIQLEVGNLGLDKLKSKFESELGVLGGDINDIMSQGLTPEISSAIESVTSDESIRASIGQFVEALKPTTEELEELSKAYEEAGKKPPEALTKYLNNMEFMEALSKGKDDAEKWLKENKIEAEVKAEIKPKVETPKKGKRVKASKIVGKKADGTATVTANVKGKAKVAKKAKTPSGSKLITKKSTKADVKVNLTGKKGKKKKVKVKSSDVVKNKSVKQTVKADITGKKNIKNTVSVSASDFNIPDSVSKTVTVNVTPSYGVTQSSKSKKRKKYRGGIVGPGIPGFADGGYVQGGSQLITVAEEGTPEAIIPLGAHRRQRALELYDQVGDYLGVGSEGYARGGIVGGGISAGHGGSGDISVDVGGITIKIEAKDGQSLVDSIRENEDEVTEVIAGVLNRALKGKYANTPAGGTA